MPSAHLSGHGRETGQCRIEGRHYVVRDGDVLLLLILIGICFLRARRYSTLRG